MGVEGGRRILYKYGVRFTFCTRVLHRDFSVSMFEGQILHSNLYHVASMLYFGIELRFYDCAFENEATRGRECAL